MAPATAPSTRAADASGMYRATRRGGARSIQNPKASAARRKTMYIMMEIEATDSLVCSTPSLTTTVGEGTASRSFMVIAASWRTRSPSASAVRTQRAAAPPCRTPHRGRGLDLALEPTPTPLRLRGEDVEGYHRTR